MLISVKKLTKSVGSDSCLQYLQCTHLNGVSTILSQESDTTHCDVSRCSPLLALL